jgi:tight adherence protein B
MRLSCQCPGQVPTSVVDLVDELSLAHLLERLRQVAVAGSRSPTLHEGGSEFGVSQLRAFAADLDNPAGDMVVASLLLAATRQARNLAERLGTLAASAREQAAARMRIQTEGATTRTSVRIIIAITLVMAVGQVLLNRTFLAPYDTLAGQVVLAIVGATFAVGIIWLSRISRIARGERVLAGANAHPQVVTR